MRFGPREIFLLLTLLAIPISSYFLVFEPQNQEIAQARQEIEHKREMLEKLKEVTSRNESLLQANEQMDKSISAIEARLPSNKEVDGVVRQISSLAVQVGLEPPSIKSADTIASAQYKEQPMTVSTKGNFRGFYKFLIELERLPRITRIPNLKLTRAKDANGAMEAEFTLSIYFQEDKEKSDERAASAGKS